MKIEKINQWFTRQGEWIIRRRWWVLVIFVLLLAVGVGGLKYMNISTSWNDYFLEDDPMLVQTEDFREIFGNYNLVDHSPGTPGLPNVYFLSFSKSSISPMGIITAAVPQAPASSKVANSSTVI